MLTSISTLKAGDRILEFLKEIENSEASMIHCDVMDGKFVKNVSFLNLETINKIKLSTSLPLDVHLMVEKPWKMVKAYTKNRLSNILTVHYESFEKEKDIIKTLKQIKKGRCLAGLSFDLNTNISDKFHLLHHCDLILLMSVRAGLGGQNFNENSLNKIEVLREYINRKNLNVLIEVDGGINLKNSSQIKKAGGDIIVLGTSFYSTKNKKEFINKMI